MNSKSPRLLTLLTSTFLLLAALAAGAPAAPAAAKKCPQGKVAWKLEGGSACVSGKLPGGKAGAAPAIAETWLLSASRQLPGGKLRLSSPLRRALPRAGAVLAREIGSAGGAGISSQGAAPRGQVVERYGKVIGQEDLGNGVVLEGRLRAKIYADESHELDVELEVRDRKGDAIRFAPDYRMLFTPEDEVECPTAGGRVTVLAQGSMGGTVTQLKNGRPVASRTATQSWKIRARGQVGTDARLQSVTADVSMSLKNYERGLQMETTVGVGATLSREGKPRVSGSPTASVSIKAAGASRAEEREAEAEYARALAGSSEVAEALAGTTTQARARLLEAEPSWYALPNECAQIAWDPGAGITLEPEQTRRVTGAVIARRDGGQASGRIELGDVGPGRLIPVAPGFSAAAPASFIAAGAEPNAAGLSVQATAIATSTAGRAQATWFARATPMKLPERFVGTIASTSATAGLTRSFAGSATYARTSVVRGPDGSLHAWYELTAAGLGEAKETLGPISGCRLEATGTNGRIESGELELRVLPSGEVLYALLYDLRVDSQFLPTDCPPPGPAAFDGEIVVFLNSRRPGPVDGQMRAVGAGFQIQENGVGDVTDLAGLTTTASWTLVPG
jgi:hypothetical protein